MKSGEMQILLKRSGVTPSRKLGQNFLTDKNFTDWIASESGAAPGKNILEVGPGFGALTERLLNAGANVAAIEFDSRITEWLRINLVPRGLQLIEGDACKINFDTIFNGEPYALVSNLPYSAGTVIIANRLETQNPPQEMLVMLQKEVAQRLCADSGDKSYGSLSVRANAAYNTHLLRIAPPELFYPRPEVDSAVIRMTLRENLPSLKLRLALSRLVRIGFSQRRKKIIKQLAGVYGRDKIEKIFAQLDISLDVRAEHIPAAKYIQMAEILNNEQS